MPQTQGVWLNFTTELELKLHFLSVVGTETEWVYWESKKWEKFCRVHLDQLLWRLLFGRAGWTALLHVKSVQLLRQLWLWAHQGSLLTSLQWHRLSASLIQSHSLNYLCVIWPVGLCCVCCTHSVQLKVDLGYKQRQVSVFFLAHVQIKIILS